MSVRPPWLVRVALLLVPASWRDSVAQDLVDLSRPNSIAPVSAFQIIVIAVSLHWVFTRGALMSDIRYAVRSLVHARWFTIGTVLTFALGIGVNVAVFSAVDRVLFRPLPYAHANELAILGEFSPGQPGPYGTLPASYVVQARRLASVQDLCTSEWNLYSYTASPDPVDEEPLRFVPVTYNTLSVLGVRLFAGRDFTREDARHHHAALLLSYDAWQRRFAARRDVFGQQLWTSRTPAEVVGVLPREFIPATIFPNPRWDGLVLDFDTLEAAGPTDRQTPAYVRLKPGVSLAAAQSELDVLARQIQTTLPPRRAGAMPSAIRLAPLRQLMFGPYNRYLWLITTAAVLVLLVACGNLASLLLVRFRSREQLAAVQTALGATAGRLLWIAVLEAGLVALAGAVVGALVVGWTSSALRAALPPVFSRYAAPVTDLRVLGFTLAVAVACAILAGLVPAWRLSRVDVIQILQRSGATARGRRLRMGWGFLAAEAALSVVLVTGALVTGRSLMRLEHVDLGFDPVDLVRVSVSLPPAKDPEVRFRQYAETLDIIRQLPGVQSAAASNSLFLTGGVGWEPLAKGYDIRVGTRANVTGRYFETLGMRPLAGRTIADDDVASRRPIAILSFAGVQLLWPGASPSAAIGRTLAFPGELPLEVAGVVADVRSAQADAAKATLYVPIKPEAMRWMDYIARVAPDSQLSVADLRARLRQQVAVPTSVAIGRVEKSLDDRLSDQRFRATLFLSFGIVALMLSGVGLYAVGTFEVSLRTSEMGIRLTLGASTGDVTRLVILEALAPVAAGILAGVVVTYWAAQFMQSFLFQVDARSPWLYVIIAAVLLASAALAAWLPARRAARTDPAAALRAQ